MAAPTDPRPPRTMLPGRVLEPGQRVGPYEILSLLGAGGMGEVYRARDTRLERQAAIKVLASRDAPHSLLLAEAQAMAQLSHPNVVTVYDVGTVGDLVYVAMELIEGQTLRGWLAASPRGWRDVVATFVSAGRGLAAAHAAGMVHRDFKPDNVLVGRDGRVCVSDFGLAGVRGAESAAISEPDLSGDTLQFSVALCGTPAYMSPEQHLGQDIDARSDQFAFCVALHEALYGARPFGGSTLREVQRSILAGEVPRPPGAARVPARLRAIVLRGLSRERAARFPSMDALVAALAHDPAARRRRALLVAGLVATSGLAVVGLTRHREIAVPVMCEGGQARLARAWGPTQKGAMARAFATSSRPHAPATFDKVAATLDAYAGEWSAMHRNACEAQAVRHEQSATILDLRMACLERRAGELGALVGLLTGKLDGDLVDRATSAAHTLTAVHGCADVAALAAPVPTPDNPATRMVVAGLRARLDAARVHQLAGKTKTAVAIAAAAAAEARGLGYAPLVAEALFTAADLRDKSGDWKTAEATLGEALQAASKGHDDLMAAQILVKLVWIIGDRQERYIEGLALLPAASAAVARAGDPPGLRAGLDIITAIVHTTKGDYARALEPMQRGIALEERVGLDPVLRASSLNSLGNLLKEQGHFAEARAVYENVRTIWERELGADHPYVGLLFGNLGTLARRAGDYAEAHRDMARSLAVLEATYGPEHRIVCRVRSNLARVLAFEGRYAEAHQINAQILAAQEKTLGPDDPDLATTLQNDAVMYSEEGRFGEARRLLERELALRGKVQGEKHPDVAGVHINLATTYAGERDFTRARAEVQEGLSMLERNVGPQHELVALGLLTAAQIELDDHQPARALALARQSATTYEKALGAESSDEAAAVDAGGVALLALRRPAEARVEHERAVAMIERVSGATHPELTSPLTNLAEALLAQHLPADARLTLERAQTLHGGGPDTPSRIHFLLARALWDEHGDRTRALGLARQARAELATGGPAAQRERAAIDGWMRSHAR